MSTGKVAALFPGQGAFYSGALATLRVSHAEVDETFAEIDRAAADHLGVSPSAALFQPSDGQPAPALATEVVQLAIYGISVATYRMLAARGFSADVLVGHSFGEIAALVCAGALTTREGADIVCHRSAVLKRLGDRSGGMAALGADVARAEKIVELVGHERAAVAVENWSGQTVVSGTPEAMEIVRNVAGALGISNTAIDSPYPFHCPPIMARIEPEFTARLRSLSPRPLQTPVYSPILGRHYSDKDDLASCLGQHLLQRVRFSQALERLAADGVSTWVECGASSALSRFVGKSLAQANPVAFSVLSHGASEAESWERAIRALTAAGAIPTLDGRLGEYLLPGVSEAAFVRFWSERGAATLGLVEQEFHRWQASAAARAEARPDLAGNRLRPVDAPAVPPTAASALPKVEAPGRSRAELFQELVEVFAAALEYPPEVFVEEVDLEAELGIDSVKQIQLLTKLEHDYRLPARAENFRLTNYRTFGQITDLVYSLMQQKAAVSAVPMAG
jgi:malonyl CoA-acyl carrier protein transacylase/acyl carrier protein